MPFFIHWTVKGGAPVATTWKVAVWPRLTVLFTGCLVIIGGSGVGVGVAVGVGVTVGVGVAVGVGVTVGVGVGVAVGVGVTVGVGVGVGVPCRVPISASVSEL